MRELATAINKIYMHVHFCPRFKSVHILSPKTLPTIWHTYMKLVTKYQIPVINSCLEKYLGRTDRDKQYTPLPLWGMGVYICNKRRTIDDRNLIFGHKLHIGMPYCGKRFWTRHIPTSWLPT
jgi:hypothetical protein